MDTKFIIAALLIAAVWSVYLLPAVFGDRRSAPLNSTEEFDRWTHLMADVQRRPNGRVTARSRDVMRVRRRRTLGLLIGLAVVAGALALWRGSMTWALVHLFFDSLIGLYAALLTQMKRQRDWRLKVTHVADRKSEYEEPQVRVIAN